MTSTTDPALPTETSPASRRWEFFGTSALPADPLARSHEKRGRKWLFVSYFLCPCHVPVTLALLGALFGGTAIGAALTGNALRVGIVLTTLYAIVLWRGFRQIRRAKQIQAAGGNFDCTPQGSCEIIGPFATDRNTNDRSESPDHTWAPTDSTAIFSPDPLPDDRESPRGIQTHASGQAVGAEYSVVWVD